MTLIESFCLEPLLNSALLLSSLETSAVAAESSERRGGEEHLNASQRQSLRAADFIAFDYAQKTVLLNVVPSPYSVETLIGSSAANENTLKLNLSVCNLSPSSHHPKVRV